MGRKTVLLLVSCLLAVGLFLVFQKLAVWPWERSAEGIFRPAEVAEEEDEANWRRWIGRDGEPRYTDILRISEDDFDSMTEVADLLDVLYVRWKSKEEWEGREDCERFFLALKAALLSPMALSESGVAGAMLEVLEELEWSTSPGVRLRAMRVRMEYERAKEKHVRGW